MGMESHASSCFCCSKPSTSRATAMDIDSALNELGMLSTTSNSRREYMRERIARGRDREKTLSEPGLTRNYSEPLNLSTAAASTINGNSMAVSPSAPTPSNSPSRPGALGPGAMGPGYQIVCINPQFVTSLTATSPTANRMPNSLASAATAVVATSTGVKPEEVRLRVIDLGAKYSQDSLEHEAYSSRTRRTKSARLKRFKKPYEVPWRHQVERCFGQSPACANGTPEKSMSRSAERPSASNTSTPEKSGTSSASSEVCTVTRSKSLDEIDFNKLRLAESVNHNFSSAQRLDVENMAHHLQNLQVNE